MITGWNSGLPEPEFGLMSPVENPPTYMAHNMSTAHGWRFFRAGGFDQVRLDTGADLVALDQLDQKLWVALACPTSGLHFDSRTLQLIDSDLDGRVRAPELIRAVKWAGTLLKNPDDLIKGGDVLPLKSINEATAEGQAIVSSATSILAHLGKKDAGEISLADTTDTARIFAQTAFNGDGIIVEDSAATDELKAVVRDIVACLGAEQDRSGKPGLSQTAVDRFCAEAEAYSSWWKKAEADQAVLPLGEATGAALDAVKAVQTKVEDYYARCRLAAFDARALAALNREEKEYLALAAKDLTITSAEVAGFPIARIEAGKALPLTDGVNPAWAAALTTLREVAVEPLLGDRTALTEADWALLKARLAPFEGWLAAKAGAAVERLGLARIRQILSSNVREELGALLAKDKAEEKNASAIAAVEKLIRYRRDLHLLCTNFVNFADFYNRGEPAIFQAGTLYLDQRSCRLTLPVEDAGRHATMAGLAGAYLAYCECVRKGTNEKRQIVAAFTDGDSENLMVGRNGIFYDRQGRDWDATITKIIDNPIGLRQAFWAPYKKFVRLIEEQVAKRAAAAEAAADTKLAQTAATAVAADKTKAAPPKKVDVGTVAALGVAFGAIGTFFAALMAYATGIVKLGPLAILGAILGVILLISGPSMIIAYLKLRKRNLGPMLDANGWAVNAKTRVNVPFGQSLTGLAKLPPGASRNLVDPYAEKKSLWPKLAVLALALYIVYAALNNLGYVHEWTGGRIGIDKTSAAAQQEASTDTAKPAADAAPAAPAGK